MYNAFFGFREKPFKLTPNPAYLFLSQSYEEALAHLRYATSEGEGFFEIVGEVGTGKTTLCRFFLEGLDEDFEAAYIFNPKLDSIQLLKVINDELGIDSDYPSAKELIDVLNRFLLEKKAEGKRVIVIVDEAQNLANEVLEQLRLLSNLETTTDKLLHIVLVGQPELREKLNSYDLRQLAQRITMNLTLFPLTLPETEDYINHRIQIASRGQTLRIGRGALNQIFKYSRGIPRLINIVCDRSLLTAFSFNQHEINANVVKSAIRELTGPPRRSWNVAWLADAARRKKTALALSLILLAAVALIFAFFISGPSRVDQTPQTPTAKSQVKETEPKDISPAMAVDSQLGAPLPANAPMPKRENVDLDKSAPAPFVATAALEPEPEKKANPTFSPLKPFLESQYGPDSRNAAVASVADLWNPGEAFFWPDDPNEMADPDYLKIASQKNGFSFYTFEWRFELIRRLNLPSILSFYIPEKPLPIYLALTGMEDGDIFVFRSEKGEEIRVNPSDVDSYWSGDAMILWKDFRSITGTIPFYGPPNSILNLKTLLNDILDGGLNLDPIYDNATRRAIMTIQRENGLLDDGVVGSLTKMTLYNMRGGFPIPHIMRRP